MGAVSEIKRSGNLCLYLRPNRATQQLVDALAYATGNEFLRCGTFLALTGLTRAQSVYSASFRWCPACLNEFARAEAPPYFKLQWQLLGVEFCLIHRTHLRWKCDACESTQRGSGAWPRLAICRWCGLSLAGEPKPISNFGNSWVANYERRWRHDGADLVQLVEMIGTHPSLRLPAHLDTMREKLRKLIRELREKSRSAPPCVVLLLRSFDYFSDSELSLKTARNISFVFGIPLPDFLAGNLHDHTALLDKSWDLVLPADMLPTKRRKPPDRETARRKIHGVLSSYKNCDPPSLKRVATETGISLGCFRYRYAKEARAIAERHRIWRNEVQQRKELRARASAVAFFTEAKYALEAKSRKRALRVLRQETNLPKNILRRAIHEVVKALS